MKMVTANAGRTGMKWKEMAMRGEKPLKEICETFGVSRQALSKAIEKVSQAAMDALEPKKAGRKPKSRN